MGRKPHRIAYLGQRPAPSAVLCVQCCRTSVYAGDADEYGMPEVQYWHCAGVSFTGSRPNGYTESHGEGAASFWAHLETAFRGVGEILLLSAGAREHAAALNLWDKILGGCFTVFGYDPTAKDGGQGYVVLESPPTVIRFVEGKSKRIYTWIDPANFGSKGFMGTADDGQATAATCADIAKDVREWYVGYVGMLEALKLGSPEHTAASQAAQGFRMSYMQHTMDVHDNDAVLNLERAALFGGRNECNFIGTILSGSVPPVNEPAEMYPNWQAGLFDGPPQQESEPAPPEKRAVFANAGPIYQLDYNSLYPSVAKDSLLPVRLRGVIHSPSVRTLLAACQCMPVVATVRIETEVPCVPVWVEPVQDYVEPVSVTRRIVSGDRARRRMVFPVGNFMAVLCGPEILLAAKHGKIVSCGVAALYDGRPIYTRWVDNLYRMRQKFADEKMGPLADCVKAILCASFAKWAQLKRRWEDEPGELSPWPWDQWWREGKESGELEQWRCFAWNVQRMVIEGEPGDSMPAITAYINSLGRCRLWEAMQTCDRERVYYCDTDSVWTDQKGYDKCHAAGLIHATELGKLKVAGTYSAVEMFGLKRYLADGKLTVAGANGETVRTSDAWALALRPLPTHTFLRMHRPPGIDLRTVRMRLNMPYRHGMLDPGGWVTPWTIFDR